MILVPALADVERRATSNAERTVALIDSTKFGRASLMTIAPAQELDAVVTDDALDADVRATYEAGGVRIEVAPS